MFKVHNKFSWNQKNQNQKLSDIMEKLKSYSIVAVSYVADDKTDKKQMVLCVDGNYQLLAYKFALGNPLKVFGKLSSTKLYDIFRYVEILDLTELKLEPHYKISSIEKNEDKFITQILRKLRKQSIVLVSYIGIDQTNKKEIAFCVDENYQLLAYRFEAENPFKFKVFGNLSELKLYEIFRSFKILDFTELELEVTFKIKE